MRGFSAAGQIKMENINAVKHRLGVQDVERDINAVDRMSVKVWGLICVLRVDVRLGGDVKGF